MSDKSGQGRCAVVVVSCDQYSDLWTPFFTLFWRYWPDCPFRVYLTANTRRFDQAGVLTVLSGGESHWGQELRKCLQGIQEPEVVLMLEDFFLRSPVDTAALHEAMEEWRGLGGRSLRLHPDPGPDARLKKTAAFGVCSAGAPYRVSLQATLWTRSALLELLRDDETAWEFEVRGTQRAAAMPDGFYSTYQSLLPYKTHVVEKGQWYRDAARAFGKLGIGCDFSRRQIMPVSTYARLKYQRAWSSLLALIPWQTRQRWRTRLSPHPRMAQFLRRLRTLRAPHASA